MCEKNVFRFFRFSASGKPHSSLPTTPVVSASTSQPSTSRQLADPTFVASLLSQPPTSASPELPLPSSTPSSSLADHVSTKTKQAILRGEYVEFDLLLPENSSLLTDNELTGLSISVGGKQVDLPNPRKKKRMLILSINGCPPSPCIVRFCSSPSLGGQSRCSPTRRSSDQPNGNSQDLHGSLMTSISVGKRPAIFPSIGDNVIPNFTL